MPQILPLTIRQQWLLGILSFLLVAFGQPAWSAWLTPVAAISGYSTFGRILLAHAEAKKRFWLGSTWFFAVQLVQLYWFTSHPFHYIYIVYVALSIMLGLQFGFLSIFIRLSNLKRICDLLAISALWTILEWSRLYYFSGFSWNPVGLGFTSNIFSLQFASVGGIFGLSFLVIFVNLLALRAYAESDASEKKRAFAYWAIALALPYAFGFVHLQIHQHDMHQQAKETHFKALLVQTAFPTEDNSHPKKHKNRIDEVVDDWRQILHIVKKFDGQKFDLIVLPEFVVPFGAYAFAFPLSDVKRAFVEILGENSLQAMPGVHFPFSAFQKTARGPQLLVNNSYWIQSVANYFDAPVLAGLEDAEDISSDVREHYSAAMYFTPQRTEEEKQTFTDPIRYQKQVLVPMGEYIPFEFCRQMAASYGVTSSFTPGKGPTIIPCNGILFAPSICYEETFGHIICRNRQQGADLIVNITNDAWYPNSHLAKQHFDLARLRTVENGVPLLRASNNGITGAFDSLGRIVAVLGGDHPEKVEWVPDALLVNVPTYHYWTLYSQFGDVPLIAICAFLIIFFCVFSKRS